MLYQTQSPFLWARNLGTLRWHAHSQAVINHCSLTANQLGKSVAEVTHGAELCLSSFRGRPLFCSTGFSVGTWDRQLASPGMSKQEGVSQTDNSLFLQPQLRSDSPAGMPAIRSQVTKSRPQCRWENWTGSRRRAGRSLGTSSRQSAFWPWGFTPRGFIIQSHAEHTAFQSLPKSHPPGGE